MRAGDKVIMKPGTIHRFWFGSVKVEIEIPPDLRREDRAHEETRIRSVSYTHLEGAACIQAEEILCMSAGKQVGYYSFYSYPELMKKAEEILDGRKLTEEERRKYFADN